MWRWCAFRRTDVTLLMFQRRAGIPAYGYGNLRLPARFKYFRPGRTIFSTSRLLRTEIFWLTRRTAQATWTEECSKYLFWAGRLGAWSIWRIRPYRSRQMGAKWPIRFSIRSPAKAE